MSHTRLLSKSNTDSRPTQSSIPPGSVNEYQLRLGRQKAGMVHSVSGWTRGVQVKLWDPLRTRAIPERLRGVFTTRRCTNVRLPYLTLMTAEWNSINNKYFYSVFLSICYSNVSCIQQEQVSLITYLVLKPVISSIPLKKLGWAYASFTLSITPNVTW